MVLFCDVPVMPQRAMRLQQTNIRNVCSYITRLFGVRSGMMLVCVLHQQSQILTVPTIGTIFSVWFFLLLVYGKVCFVTCPCSGHFNLQSHSYRVTCVSTCLHLFVLKHVRGCRKIRSNFDVGVLSALYLALQKTGAFKSFSEEGFEGPKVLQLSSALSHHLPRNSD